MHALQPKHTKLEPSEVEKVLKKYNISLTQLPKISKKDPAISEDYKKGDIIKVERGEETYYRVVL